MTPTVTAYRYATDAESLEVYGDALREIVEHDRLASVVRARPRTGGYHLVVFVEYEDGALDRVSRLGGDPVELSDAERSAILARREKMRAAGGLVVGHYEGGADLHPDGSLG